MYLKEPTARALRSSTNSKLVLIVTTLAGGVLLLTASLVALRQLQRRRNIGQSFQEAYLHEPGLTWDEYGRRGHLTRSRLMFEEEVQRSNMIRKCQQSRASDNKDTATSGEPSMRPHRSRSRTWHGQSTDMEGNPEQRNESPQVTVAGWASAEATVDRTRQLLHCSKSPRLPENEILWSRNGRGIPQFSPAERLNTPPLLSHPLFRDRIPHCRLKHMSLPAELTRAKIKPICTFPQEVSQERDTQGSKE